MSSNLRPKAIVGISLLITVLVLSGIITFNIIKNSHGTSQVDQLSDRAQEFITKDASDGEGLWSTTNFEKPTNITDAGNKVTTNCFTLVLPLETTNQSTEQSNDRCTFRSKLLSPPAQLVISSYRSVYPLEDSSLAIRLKDTDTYTELPIHLNTFPKSWLFRGSDNVTAFAWKDNRMVTVSLGGMSQPDLAKPEFFTQILDNLTVTPNNEVGTNSVRIKE